ncbi:hypothetical protein [Scytonema sp. NUACC21]
MQDVALRHACSMGQALRTAIALGLTSIYFRTLRLYQTAKPEMCSLNCCNW